MEDRTEDGEVGCDFFEEWEGSSKKIEGKRSFGSEERITSHLPPYQLEELTNPHFPPSRQEQRKENAPGTCSSDPQTSLRQVSWGSIFPTIVRLEDRSEDRDRPSIRSTERFVPPAVFIRRVSFVRPLFVLVKSRSGQLSSRAKEDDCFLGEPIRRRPVLPGIHENSLQRQLDVVTLFSCQEAWYRIRKPRMNRW